MLYHVRRTRRHGPAGAGSRTHGAERRPREALPVERAVPGGSIDPLGANGVDRYLPPIEAFQEELREAGPGAVETFERFALHLSPAQLEELDLRIVAILDEYVLTEHERMDQPMHGGLFVLHRVAG